MFSIAERYESIDQYVEELKNNHWNDEEITLAVELLKKSSEVEWHDDGSFTITIC